MILTPTGQVIPTATGRDLVLERVRPASPLVLHLDRRLIHVLIGLVWLGSDVD
jgi:hypothetical protein